MKEKKRSLCSRANSRELALTFIQKQAAHGERRPGQTLKDRAVTLVGHLRFFLNWI